jgi:hypothetical protein
MSELPAREMTFSHKSSKPNLQVVAENPHNVTGESIFRPQSGPSQEDGHSSGSNEDLVDRADARWKNSA